MTRFRELRLQKGYTQEAFRKIYNERYNRNYTSAAISMIEHGKRMPELGALIHLFRKHGRLDADVLTRMKSTYEEMRK